MRRTHLSLYYLAGYLIPAGLLLLFVPEFATKLLLSNRTYDYAPFHLAGVLLLVIGILIAQIIRFRLEQLYTTTLVARALISAKQVVRGGFDPGFAGMGAHEETDGKSMFGVWRVGGETVWNWNGGVNEGADVPLTISIHKVQPRGWSKRQGTVLDSRIIWREEGRAEHQDMDWQKQSESCPTTSCIDHS